MSLSSSSVEVFLNGLQAIINPKGDFKTLSYLVQRGDVEGLQKYSNAVFTTIEEAVRDAAQLLLSGEIISLPHSSAFSRSDPSGSLSRASASVSR